MVSSTKDCWKALSFSGFNRSENEKQNLKFRRSLYFVKDIKAGVNIKKSDIRRIRPGYGLSPKFMEEIINKKVIRDVKKGDRVTWEILA